MATTEVTTTAQRQEELRPVVEAWVEQVGGWNMIRARDIGRVIMLRNPELWKNIVVADQSMSVFLGRQEGQGGATIGPAGLDAIEALSREINEAPDPRAHFYNLARDASGMATVPIKPGAEWPFHVELIPVEKLYANDEYQRPVDETFVRKTVLAYDESLIGTIDVALERNRYAIMDGRQRVSASMLVGKTAVWCNVYTGMKVAEQARFFHHKNRDRKTVHPYYHFRARRVAGDLDAEQIGVIVERHGYKLGISALADDTITAIRAVEEVFGWTAEARDNALDPTLEKLYRLWFGVKGGKDGAMIRGFGRFFAAYRDEEIEWQHLEEQLAALSPLIIQGRAKDLTMRMKASTWNVGIGVARALVTFHNTGLPRERRLDPKRLFLASRRFEE